MRLGQELEEKAGLVRKREGGIRAVSADLLKANEIIKKLQDQVRQEHSKGRYLYNLHTELGGGSPKRR